MKARKEKSGSVKIDPAVYDDMATYCQKNGVKVSFFATQSIREKLQSVNPNEKNKDTETRVEG